MEPLIDFGSLARAGGALALMTLPGLALVSRFRFATRLSWPFRIGLGAATSLGLHLLLATLLDLSGLSFDVYFYTTLGLALACLPFALMGIRRGERWMSPVVVGLLLFLFGVISTRPVTVRSDSLDHVATVRAILSSGELEPNDVFYSEGDGVKPDIRKGYYHAWLAALARISGLDPLAMWMALRPWAMLLGCLVFAGLADKLLGSRSHALVALLAYPLLIHGNAASFLDTMLYPHYFKWILVWAALALILDELKSSDLSRRALLMLLAGALPAMHIFGPALLLLAVGSIPISLWVFRTGEPSRRGWDLFLMVLVASLPVLILRAVQTYHPINPLHIRASEILYLTDFLKLHLPARTLHQFSLSAIFLLPLSFFVLWRRDARSERRAVLAGLTWVPLLISFNPVAGGILLPRMGYMFVRFLGVIPFPVVAAAILGDAWNRRRGRVLSRWLPMVIVLALLLARVPPLLGLAGRAMKTRDTAMSPERWRAGIEMVRERVPEGETVATDPVTGYALPACTRHRVIAVLDQHSSPADSSISERLQDVERILSPYRPLSEAIETMKRRRTRYVLLNESFTWPFATYFDVRVPEEYAAIRERFEVAGGPFRKLGSAGECHLYELTDPTWSDSTIDARFRYAKPHAALRPDTGESHPLTDALSLLDIKVDPMNCRPGDTLTVTVRMRKDRADPPATPYKMIFRARREFGGERNRWRAVDRLYARLVGKTGGPRLEFSIHRHPVDGRYPPDLWDIGEIVEDRFDVPVPRDLEPGEYLMGIRVHARDFVRNVALADLLKPSGGIGLSVGRLMVEE